MPSEKTTTVVLNEFVQRLKDDLAPIYGLKNILSAGLLLFSRLSAEEQKAAIAQVNAIDFAEKEAEKVDSSTPADIIKHKKKARKKPSKPQGE